MRSGPSHERLVHLRIGARNSALALAALLVVGAAPASAVPSYCEALAYGTRCFGQDVTPDPGYATVPSSFPNSSGAEAEFQTRIGGSYETEGFESFADGDHGPLQIFQAATLAVAGVLSDSVDSGGTVRAAPLDDAINRGFPILSSQFWKNETVSSTAAELFRVSFVDPADGTTPVEVRSFGFYATAWSTNTIPGATALVLDLLFAGGGMTTIGIPHSEDGSLAGSALYFGVISDAPLIKAALRNESVLDPGDRIGFDAFTVAIVPEPSTGTLLGVGLAALGAGMRLRGRGASAPRPRQGRLHFRPRPCGRSPSSACGWLSGAWLRSRSRPLLGSNPPAIP